MIIDENDPLVRWAKTKLPDPDKYPSDTISPQNLTEKVRVLFRKVRKEYQGQIICKWEPVEKLPLMLYNRKNDDNLY